MYFYNMKILNKSAFERVQIIVFSFEMQRNLNGKKKIYHQPKRYGKLDQCASLRFALSHNWSKTLG